MDNTSNSSNNNINIKTDGIKLDNSVAKYTFEYPALDMNLETNISFIQSLKRYMSRAKKRVGEVSGVLAMSSILGTMVFPGFGTAAAAFVGLCVLGKRYFNRGVGLQNRSRENIELIKNELTLNAMANYFQAFLIRIDTAFKDLSTAIKILQPYVEDFASRTKKNNPEDADLIKNYKLWIPGYIDGIKKQIQTMRDGLTNEITQFNALMHGILRKSYDNVVGVSHIDKSPQRENKELTVERIENFTSKTIENLTEGQIATFSIKQLNAILTRAKALKLAQTTILTRDQTVELAQTKIKLGKVIISLSEERNRKINAAITKVTNFTPEQIYSFNMKEIEKVEKKIKTIQNVRQLTQEQQQLIEKVQTELQKTRKQILDEEKIATAGIEGIADIMKNVNTQYENKLQLTQKQYETKNPKHEETKKNTRESHYVFNLLTSKAQTQQLNILGQLDKNIAKSEQLFQQSEKQYKKKVVNKKNSSAFKEVKSNDDNTISL